MCFSLAQIGIGFRPWTNAFLLGVVDGSKSTQKTLAGSHHITELLDQRRVIPFTKNIFIQTWTNLNIYQFTIDK